MKEPPLSEEAWIDMKQGFADALEKLEVKWRSGRFARTSTPTPDPCQLEGDERMHASMNTTQCALVTAVLLAGGCASSHLSQQRLVDTQSAIDSARELDEAEAPEVSLHLKYAREQLAAAKKLMDDGERKEAHRMLERAHADAQLALAMARTERSREEARQAWSEVEDLRKQ